MRSPRVEQRISAALIGVILGLNLLSAGSLSAEESASASFRDARWSVNQGGGSASSLSFSENSSVGEVASTTAASAGYRARSGLMAIYHYPAQPSGLSASSGPTAGALYLQFIAPGSDGVAAGTQARAYQLRLSSSAGQSPALAEGFFTLAPGAATPVPQLAGTLQSVVVGGLLGGTSYYLALRALEADGTPGPISSGATIYAALATPGLDPQSSAYRLLLSAISIDTGLQAPPEELLPRAALVQYKLRYAA